MMQTLAMKIEVSKFCILNILNSAMNILELKIIFLCANLQKHLYEAPVSLITSYRIIDYGYHLLNVNLLSSGELRSLRARVIFFQFSS